MPKLSAKHMKEVLGLTPKMYALQERWNYLNSDYIAVERVIREGTNSAFPGEGDPPTAYHRAHLRLIVAEGAKLRRRMEALKFEFGPSRLLSATDGDI
jgi:hypothetical protein